MLSSGEEWPGLADSGSNLGMMLCRSTCTPPTILSPRRFVFILLPYDAESRRQEHLNRMGWQPWSLLPALGLAPWGPVSPRMWAGIIHIGSLGEKTASLVEKPHLIIYANRSYIHASRRDASSNIHRTINVIVLHSQNRKPAIVQIPPTSLSRPQEDLADAVGAVAATIVVIVLVGLAAVFGASVGLADGVDIGLRHIRDGRRVAIVGVDTLCVF